MMRRMPAKRTFAAEIYSVKEVNDRLVSATGRALKRVFVTGVLVDVTERNGVVKAQIFDGTGKLTIFCSKYQPEALVALKSIDAPAYVAVVGRIKAVDGKIFVRPEFVNTITAKEHELWLREAIYATDKALSAEVDLPHSEEERQRVVDALERAKARLQELTAS
ncbi:hypothetical protein [Archaeoglobus neptunius]|uniref:hypothetical protein n=1 Tax=Archaeoglobus neptunius TaxID=2798580 RepID=UPI001927BE0D|nr:hypothetical protein [Archaeoglobus neptunius]